ncbi:MAG: FAD-dependent oxidoreductase [Acidimicrobiales bacterium]
MSKAGGKKKRGKHKNAEKKHKKKQSKHEPDAQPAPEPATDGGPSRKQKVAVLGGGAGAITTAFELTATEALRERYEVTVYQPGWRLGGKGASGRNRAHGDRIEEHGLHVFFGFYDNAFDVMKRCYAELDRKAGRPLATWEDAFTPCDDLVIYDEWKGTWTPHQLTLPRNSFEPGSGELVSLVDKLSAFVDWIDSELRRVMGDEVRVALDVAHFLPRLVRHAPLVGGMVADAEQLGLGLLRRLLARVDPVVHEVERVTVHELLDAVSHAFGDIRPEQGFVEQGQGLVLALEALRDAVWTSFARARLDHPEVRFVFMALDLGVTLVNGVLSDRLLTVGFDEVNDEELRAWFTRHGANAVTVEHSPILRALYDLTFAYEEGDTRRPNLAAGKALQALLRIGLTYKGSIMWKMNAGMGDTIFAPLYQVLRRRGVRFEFFHWVSDLGVDPVVDRIETIEVIPQVELAGSTYDPLYKVNKLPCWPSKPFWKQLEDGHAVKAELAARHTDFERSANPLGAKPRTLRRGVDFDLVVLGISPGGLGPITGEMRKRSPQFAEALANTNTVATQAAQVWTDKTAQEMGWAYPTMSVAGAYVEPLDTYCDMSHLLDREDWSTDLDVRGIGYFCGPLQEEADATQTGADRDVRHRVVTFLDRDVHRLWPRAAAYRRFRWDDLVDATNASGSARFDSQYWRANISGTELYVQTQAGTVQFRLRAEESGFENLVLAGDWTRNGIDGGSAEAAIASGRQAARALCGQPVYIPGEHGVLAEDTGAGAPPRYVEYGGYQSFPGPYECGDTTLWGFIAEADHDRLSALVDKMFTQVTRGRRRWMPMGSMVMITWGDIASIHPKQPPWSTMGDLDEPQVAVWVPVVEVEQHGDRLRAHRFWFCNPYIWLDNPFSIVSGREMFGWPKTEGWPTFPTKKDPMCSLDVFGMNFGVESHPGRHPLMEVDQVPAQPGEDAAWTDLRGMAGWLVDEIGKKHGGGLVMPGLEADLETAVSAAEMALPIIFLKQFRSITTGSRAAIQQITETKAQIQKIRGGPMLSEHQLTVHPLDSQPVGAELGLASQRIYVSFRVEMDFVVQLGEVIWSES